MATMSMSAMDVAASAPMMRSRPTRRRLAAFGLELTCNRDVVAARELVRESLKTGNAVRRREGGL